MKRNSEPFIGLSVPHMAPDVDRFVGEAFAQNWVAHVGPSVDAFERELAERVGVPESFATQSGTSALHLALLVCEVRQGDTVYCSALSFVATANPILYQGATPVFIDCEPESFGMSPVALARALSAARRAGRLPKAVIVADLYGESADLDALLALTDAYGVPLIEDAAQALGATYKGRAVGTCGRVGIYSFAGNKLLTTSAGGALVSRSVELVRRARSLGMQARDPEVRERHLELGYNYRLSNVLAGIGRSQLRVIEARIAARRAVFGRYRDALRDLPSVTFLPERPYGRSTRWLSVLLLRRGAGVTPERLREGLARRNVEARRVFQPLHTQPFLADAKFYAHGAHAACEDLFQRGLCLPSSSNLTAAEQDRVIAQLRRLLTGASTQPGRPRASSSASRDSSPTASMAANSPARPMARRL